MRNNIMMCVSVCDDVCVVMCVLLGEKETKWCCWRVLHAIDAKDVKKKLKVNLFSLYISIARQYIRRCDDNDRTTFLHATGTNKVSLPWDPQIFFFLPSPRDRHSAAQLGFKHWSQHASLSLQQQQLCEHTLLLLLWQNTCECEQRQHHQRAECRLMRAFGVVWRRPSQQHTYSNFEGSVDWQHRTTIPTHACTARITCIHTHINTHSTLDCTTHIATHALYPRMHAVYVCLFTSILSKLRNWKWCKLQKYMYTVDISVNLCSDRCVRIYTAPDYRKHHYLWQRHDKTSWTEMASARWCNHDYHHSDHTHTCRHDHVTWRFPNTIKPNEFEPGFRDICDSINVYDILYDDVKLKLMMTTFRIYNRHCNSSNVYTIEIALHVYHSTDTCKQEQYFNKFILFSKSASQLAIITSLHQHHVYVCVIN